MSYLTKEKSIKIVHDFKDIDSILNSVFAPLFFMLIKQASSLKDKIFPQFGKDKQKTNLWNVIWNESLYKKNELLPNLAYQYILRKVKFKYAQLVKESKLFDQNLESYQSQVS